MTLARCAFDTERLHAAAWQAGDLPADLPGRVATVLTEATTRFLPPDWHGDYDDARARRWIEERDAEGPTLLVTERAGGETVGLVILFEEPRAGGSLIDVRLGYVIAESQWGRGLASELVAGLVGWCREDPGVASIAGGVEADNAASASVLLKNGFQLVPSDGSAPPGEELYRLELRPARGDR